MSEYYIYILSGLGFLIFVFLVFIGLFYRKESRGSQKIIEDLQNKVKTYENIIAQLQQKGQDTDEGKTDPSKKENLSGRSGKEKDEDKRIWVKIQGFD